MIGLSVVVTDGVSDRLHAFGRAAPSMMDRILRMVGSQYRAELKKNYLSGQMLGRSSGDLVRSLYVGRARGKKHVYIVGSKAIRSKQDFGGVAIRRSDASRIKLANIYEHGGGYSIAPKEKKALMFVAADGTIVFTKRVRGQSRPFMTASARAFNWTQAFSKTTDRIVIEETGKIGLGAKP